MFTLLLWVVIFALGLVLYFSPVFFNRRAYEGFENAQTEDPTLYLKQLKEILQPQVAGTPNLGSLSSLPDGAATTSSTPASTNPPPTDSTLLAQGKAFKSTVPKPPVVPSVATPPASKKAATKEDKKAKDAPAISLQEQCEKLHKSQPAPNVPTHHEPHIDEKLAPYNRKNRIHEPPVQPKPQIQYVPVPVEKKCPRHKCPPPAQCPDMSQYIRKDSIPCWSCKLG